MADTDQKTKFSIKNFIYVCANLQFPADLLTFIKVIINEKLHCFVQFEQKINNAISGIGCHLYELKIDNDAA